MLKPGGAVELYGRSRDGLSLEAQLERLLSPPLWPLKLHDFPARVTCLEPEPPFDLGPFHVEAMEAAHPGGCTVYRVAAGRRAVVYATDFEHSPEALAALADFARGADLLLYDGAYTSAAEYEAHRGFGHSTAQAKLWVQRESGVRQLRLVHPDIGKSDAMLMDAERSLGVRYAGRERRLLQRFNDRRVR